MTATGPARMLPRKFTLHDVDDTEKHCRRVVSHWRRRTEANLNPSDEEDLIAYLLETAWELAEFKYDAASGKPFASYSFSILTLRCTDWLRRKEGRTVWKFSTWQHVRERPVPLSLDGPAGTDPDAGSLGEALADRSGDSPTDRLADLPGLHGGGSLERDWDFAILRAAAARDSRARARASNERQRLKREHLKQS